MLRAIDIGELREVWPEVKPAVEEVRTRCREPWIAEDVYHAIASGQALLMMDEVGRTVAVVRPAPEPYQRKPTLLIWVYWSASGGYVMAEHREQFIDLAKSLGCRSVTFMSPRRGWERVAPALGLTPIHTRWELEV